jgi:acyl-CoA thioester hydrolase
MEAYKRKVHYYETDQMGIVHHSNYIRWFEEARIDFLEKIGLEMSVIEERGVQIPVLSVASNYRQMTRFGEEFEVRMTVEKYNGIKMSISYEVVGTKDNVIKNTGTSEHCFIDMTGKIISLKKSHPDMHMILEKQIGFTTNKM